MIPLKDNLRTRQPALLTIGLVVLNVLVFLGEIGIGGPGESVAFRIQRAALVGGAIPYEIVTWRDIGPPDLLPPPFTIFTSMFIHGGWAHLGGNMPFLWVFGPAVEDRLGRLRFLGFYLASGVAAALTQTLLSFAAGDPLLPMVGASGAIAGVLAAYLVLFPWARVLTVIPIFVFVRFMYLPAAFFIGVWFLLQVLYALIGGGGSGVAFFAHVGGFVCGWLLVKVMAASR